MIEKRCNKCDVVKAAAEFSRKRASPDGLQHVCRQCQASYRYANRERTRKVGREYRKNTSSCAVAGCVRAAKSNAAGSMCDTHTWRLRHWGTTDDGGGVYRWTGKSHPGWRGDEIGYSAAHVRVYAARGKASEYACVDCSTTAAAGSRIEWSYAGGCPRELFELALDSRNGKAREMAYSPDPSSYDARCVACHIKFDKTREAVSA